MTSLIIFVSLDYKKIIDFLINCFIKNQKLNIHYEALNDRQSDFILVFELKIAKLTKIFKRIILKHWVTWKESLLDIIFIGVVNGIVYFGLGVSGEGMNPTLPVLTFGLISLENFSSLDCHSYWRCESEHLSEPLSTNYFICSNNSSWKLFPP